MEKKVNVERTYGWACDFETNNYEEDCRVWCWGMENIKTGQYFRGKSIQTFLVKCMEVKEGDFYFHNLKFDDGFILSYLLLHGYRYTDDFNPGVFEFSTLITDMGQHYTLTIGGARHKMRFIDSLKIIPASIEQMPKMFGLDTFKGEIDYTAYRPVGYEPTAKEWDYLQRDVHILAQSLRFMFDHKLRKITAASNAYTDLQERVGKDWTRLFPQIDREIDSVLRLAYRGGYCIVGPAARSGDVEEGIVFDENSMYPDKMRNALLPYGPPVVYSGEYEPDPMFPLYVQVFRCKFHVKEGFLPTIQLKHGFGFNPTEYLEDSDDKIVELVLTNVDLNIFRDHYDIWCYEPLMGFKFMAQHGMFTEFVDYWYKIKQESDNNPAMRTLAKRMLNSAYGKFGKRGMGGKKEPYLDENGIVRYKTSDDEEMELQYLPVAMYITAWARDDVIRKGQKNYERLCYIDTDSLHFSGSEIPEGLPVHDNLLGYWKKEATFTRARYLRAKTYIEDTPKGLEVKCAGMPAAVHDQVTWENFKPGAEYEGKLQHKTVKGGVILAPTKFKIKI